MKPPVITPRRASIEATSAYYSVSRASIYRLIAWGDISAPRVGSRRVVDLHSVDRFLEREPAPVPVPVTAIDPDQP